MIGAGQVAVGHEKLSVVVWTVVMGSVEMGGGGGNE